MDLKIKKIEVGDLGTNCYLVSLAGSLLLVDPGGEVEKIDTEIQEFGKPKYQYILLTHAHFDHLLAVNELRKRFGFQLVIGEKEKEIYENIEVQGMYSGFTVPYQEKPDVYVKDGDELPFGGDKIRVIHTSGHTEGGVSYLLKDNLFSGDTLFRHTYGRTDLPTGSEDEIRESLERLFSLDEKVKVFPGHGRETTIGDEKEYFKKWKNIAF